MKSFHIVGNPDGSTSLGEVNTTMYLAPAHSGMRWTTSSPSALITCRTAGTLSKLAANVIAKSGLNSALRFLVNGSVGAINMAISTTGYQEAANTVSVSAGDTLQLRCVQVSGATTFGAVSWLFEPASGSCERFAVTNLGNIYNTFGYYPLACNALAATPSISEEYVQLRMRGPGTFRNLQIKLSTNNQGGATATFRKNSADTALTVTVGTTSTSLTEDSTNEVDVEDGDLVNFYVQGGSAGGSNNTTVEFVSVEFESTAGITYIMAAAPIDHVFQPSGSAGYLPIGGGASSTGQGQTTEANTKMRLGYAAWLLDVQSFSSPSASDGTLAVRRNGSSVATLTVPGSGGDALYRTVPSTPVLLGATDDINWDVGDPDTFFTTAAVTVRDKVDPSVRLVGNTKLKGNTILR